VITKRIAQKRRSLVCKEVPIKMVARQQVVRNGEEESWARSLRQREQQELEEKRWVRQCQEEREQALANRWMFGRALGAEDKREKAEMERLVQHYFGHGKASFHLERSLLPEKSRSEKVGDVIVPVVRDIGCDDDFDRTLTASFKRAYRNGYLQWHKDDDNTAINSTSPRQLGQRPRCKPRSTPAATPLARSTSTVPAGTSKSPSPASVCAGEDKNDEAARGKVDQNDVVLVEFRSGPLGLTLVDVAGDSRGSVKVERVVGAAAQDGRVRNGMYIESVNKQSMLHCDFDQVMEHIHVKQRPMVVGFVQPQHIKIPVWDDLQNLQDQTSSGQSTLLGKRKVGLGRKVDDHAAMEVSTTTPDSTLSRRIRRPPKHLKDYTRVF